MLTGWYSDKNVPDYPARDKNVPDYPARDNNVPDYSHPTHQPP